MTREDILLGTAAGSTGRYPLDPIRLMKAAFIVSQRGPEGHRRLFNFRPYDYGPFDATVYQARDNLLALGLLLAEPAGKYENYSLTESGWAAARELENEVGEDLYAWLQEVGAYVTSRSFSQLLREIYGAFPAYAARSIFSG